MKTGTNRTSEATEVSHCHQTSILVLELHKEAMKFKRDHSIKTSKGTNTYIFPVKQSVHTFQSIIRKLEKMTCSEGETGE